VTAGEIQAAKIEVGNRPLYRDLGGRRAPGRQDSSKRKLGLRHGLAARKRRTGRGVESGRSGAGPNENEKRQSENLGGEQQNPNADQNYRSTTSETKTAGTAEENQIQRK
jgi:hypothetical protein